MAPSRSSRSVPSEPWRLVAVAAALLLAACGSSAATPSTAPGTAAASTAAPSPSEASSAVPSSATPSDATGAPATASPTGTPPPSPVAAHWEAAGTMHLAHNAPAVLVLGGGRVLVVGSEGRDYYDYDFATDESRQAELWDPVTHKWKMTAPLPKPRASFAAVALQDGRALVAGGANANQVSYSSAYVFDPAKELWEKVGLMRSARTSPGAVVLRDGRVLVVGGRYSEGGWGSTGVDAVLAAYDATGGATGAAGTAQPPLADVDPGPIGRALATAELFDPATGSWKVTGSMRYARDAPDAVLLGDGRVLVWGSGDSNGVDERAGSTGEIYDPATGRFTLVAALPAVDVQALRDLGVPIPGGSPGTAEWGARGLVPLANGDALLIDAQWYWDPIEITRSFRYDTSRDRWIEVGKPFVYQYADEGSDKTWGVDHPAGTVVPLRDGRVLFTAGGKRTAEVLDPVKETWAKLPGLPAVRGYAPGVALDDGSVLVVGDGTYNDAFRFVPASG